MNAVTMMIVMKILRVADWNVILAMSDKHARGMHKLNKG